jgi:hypothetical protein
MGTTATAVSSVRCRRSCGLTGPIREGGGRARWCGPSRGRHRDPSICVQGRRLHQRARPPCLLRRRRREGEEGVGWHSGGGCVGWHSETTPICFCLRGWQSSGAQGISAMHLIAKLIRSNESASRWQRRLKKKGGGGGDQGAVGGRIWSAGAEAVQGDGAGNRGLTRSGHRREEGEASGEGLGQSTPPPKVRREYNARETEGMGRRGDGAHAGRSGGCLDCVARGAGREKYVSIFISL